MPTDSSVTLIHHYSLAGANVQHGSNNSTKFEQVCITRHYIYYKF